MKRIKSTVSYTVPHWNLCNVDRFDFDGTPSKQLCQFCIKSKDGHKCMLYNELLSVSGGQVSKTRACRNATAGFESVIEQPEESTPPPISPKELIKHTIATYKKTVKDLVAQGYPQSLAEQAAEKALTK